MGGTQRWDRAVALPVAQALCGRLAEYCERIEIAGSIRRLKPDVGDIELLAIPKATDNFFFTDALDEAIKAMLDSGEMALRPSENGRTTYGAKNKLLVHVPSGIPLDVFTSGGAYRWGMDLVVRTGPREFNIAMMARFKRLGMQGHAYDGRGVTGTQGQEEDCPTEERVFALLNWEYVAPELRR